MLCIDAAATDAENLCKWCLTSPVDIGLKLLFRILWNVSARRVQYAKMFYLVIQREKKIIHVIESCCKQGMLIKSCRYWLLNW